MVAIDIDRLCDTFEVRRIAARLVSAQMVNDIAFWDVFLMMQNPCNAVSIKDLAW